MERGNVRQDPVTLAGRPAGGKGAATSAGTRRNEGGARTPRRYRFRAPKVNATAG